MERGQIWDSSCFLRLVSLPVLWSTGMECSRARVWGSSCFLRLVSSPALWSRDWSRASVWGSIASGGWSAYLCCGVGSVAGPGFEAAAASGGWSAHASCPPPPHPTSLSLPPPVQRYLALTIQGKVKPEGYRTVYQNENQQG
jgi:hypothetical protein